MDKNIWLDEFLTIKEARELSFFNFSEAIGLNPYFAIVWAALKIFGSKELPLRILSVLFSLGSILSLYLIGKKLFSKKSGLLAAAFFSVFPLSVLLSQEIRMYSMLAFFSSWQIYFFTIIMSSFFSFDIQERKRGRLYAGYCIFTLLMLFTHLSALILLFAELIMFYIFSAARRIPFKNMAKFLGINLVCGLAFFAWFGRVFLTKVGFLSSNGTYIKEYVSFGGFWGAMASFLDLTVGHIAGHPVSNLVYAILIISILTFVLLTIDKPRANYPQEKTGKGFSVFAIGIVLLFVFAEVYFLDFIPRHYFIIVPIICLLLALTVEKIGVKNKFLYFVITSWILLMALGNSLSYLKTDKESEGRKWKELTNYVIQNESCGTAIIVPLPYISNFFKYYYKGSAKIIELDNLEELTGNLLVKENEIGIPFFDERLASVLIKEADKYDRLLVVNDIPALRFNDPKGVFQSSLEKKFSLQEETCFPPRGRILCVDTYLKKSD